MTQLPLEIAASRLSKAIESSPGKAVYFLNRGAIFAKNGLHAEATADFTRVIELDPTGYLGYYNLFNVQNQQGKK